MAFNYEGGAIDPGGLDYNDAEAQRRRAMLDQMGGTQAAPALPPSITPNRQIETAAGPMSTEYAQNPTGTAPDYDYLQQSNNPDKVRLHSNVPSDSFSSVDTAEPVPPSAPAAPVTPTEPQDPYGYRAQVRGYYQKYLGRDPENEQVWSGWEGKPGAEEAIKSSPEAKAYAARPHAGGPANGDWQGWFNDLVKGKPYNQQTLLDLEPQLRAAGVELTGPNAEGERTKIKIPGIGWVRVGFGEGRPVWIPQGGGGPSGPGGGGGAGGDALQAQVREQLLALMKQGNAPIDENALQIRQPFEAASAAAQREQQRERTALAERLYASGNLGGRELEQGIQQSAERNALGLAGLKSGLIGNEIAARRTQLAQALQLANSIGARTEAQQLQRELAQLDQQFRYSQLGQQRSQWEDQYGLRSREIENEQNYRAWLRLPKSKGGGGEG